jgi:hypothetical protein
MLFGVRNVCQPVKPEGYQVGAGCRNPGHRVLGRRVRHILLERGVSMHSPCPHCYQLVIQDANSAGKTVQCPKCNRRFQLPLLPSALADALPFWVIGVLVVLTLVAVFFV